MHAEGEIDPTRLACAIAAVPALTETFGPVLLAMANPGQVRYRPMTGHAQAVQQRMAASDVRNATMSAAAAMRRQSTLADQRGQRSMAVRFSSYAAALQREAQLEPSSGGVITYRAGEEGELSDQELLVEYARVQAELAALDPRRTDDEEATWIARRWLSEVASEAPSVAETYAELTLLVYQDPDFACAPEPRSP